MPGETEETISSSVPPGVSPRPAAVSSTQQIDIAPSIPAPAAEGKPNALVQPGGAAAPDRTDASGAQAVTIRLKKPGELFTDTKAAAATPPPAPAPVKTAHEGMVLTVRVKRATGAHLPAAAPAFAPPAPAEAKGGPAVFSQTAQINTDDLGVTTPPAGSQAPRTVRIKRPGETDAGGAAVASAESARKTIKIARPGRHHGDEPEAAPEQAQPPPQDAASAVTQRRSIGFKKQEAQETDHAVKMAQDEHELKTVRGELAPTEERPARLTWLWCCVAAAAMIVMGVTIWVFCVQLFPEKSNLKWPGRILPYNDPFFKGETKWL